MRIALLKAARASRRTQTRIGDFDAIFAELLREPGQQWDSFEVEQDAFPEAIADYDGVVITGSPASAYDDAPWVHRLLDAVRTAHAAEVPLLGICFGLQVVARALGGSVARNPLGWDVGVVEVTLSEAGRRWAPLADAPQPLRILETHADIATALPPGAVLLASSARTQVEIFSLGERVLCLQGHPELDNEMVRELIEKRLARGLLEPDRAAEGLASLERQPHRAFLEGWLRTYLREGRLPAAA